MRKLTVVWLCWAFALTGQSQGGPEADPTDRAVTALIGALEDNSIHNRLAAARALGSLGPRAARAIPALIAKVKEESPKEWLSPYGFALVKLGPKAAAALCKAAKNRKAKNRRCAVHCLASFDTPAVVATLTGLLSDKDRDVRYQAAKSLGKIGPKAKAAIADLVKATRDGDESVRLAAITALGHILKQKG
jgi:HEAT repeat protein